MVTFAPSLSSNSVATCWFTSLSSTSKTRTPWTAGKSRSRLVAAGIAFSSATMPKRFINVSNRTEGVIGFCRKPSISFSWACRRMSSRPNPVIITILGRFSRLPLCLIFRLVSMPSHPGICQFPQGIAARRSAIDSQCELSEHVCEDFASHHIVVDNQDPDAGQSGRQAFLAHISRSEAKPSREAKCATAAGLAFGPDVAFHHLHQTFRDGKAKARAPVLSGGRAIGLTEGLEEARRLLRRHPDAAVAHHELQFDAVRHTLFEPDRNDNFAAFREFHCIIHEVNQYLAEAERITNKGRRQVRLSSNEKLQVFLVSLLAHHPGKIIEHTFQAEFRLFHGELAGFNFRKVEDVVDDTQ